MAYCITYQLFNYRKDPTYNSSKTIVKSIYKLVSKFPKNEDYGLAEKLCKTSIAIPLNLIGFNDYVSAYKRNSSINQAYNSLKELTALIELAADLNFITEEEQKNIENIIEEIGNNIYVKQIDFSH